MKYLLDTDILIFFLKGKFKLKEKIENVGTENCFISEISIAELKYGAEKSANYQKHIKEVAQIQELLIVIPIYSSLDLFAKEKTRLEKIGKLIPDFDLLIGATAINNELKLVSNNVKHLTRIKNISIENWTISNFNEFM